MSTKIRKHKLELNEIVFIIFSLSFMIVHLCVFWLGVEIETLRMAFTDDNENFVGFENFNYFFDAMKSADSILRGAFVNTFKFFFLGLAMFPVQLFVAYIVYKKMAGSAFVRVVLYLPGAISGVMMAMIYQQLLLSDGPVFALLNGKWGWNIPTPLITEAPLFMIMFYDVWIGLGGNIVIWLGTLSRIPEEVLEYGKIDGVGPVREFFQIIIPLIWPTICTLLTMSLMGILGSSGSVLIFTEGRFGTYTFNYWLYDVVYKNQTQLYREAISTGLLCMIFVLPLVFGGRWFMNKFGGEVEY